MSAYEAYAYCSCHVRSAMKIYSVIIRSYGKLIIRWTYRYWQIMGVH
ncbi:hypothetical protein PT277_06815 [Acetobacteraceae bacterium ESL0709]|nr:hypothetical protein [Acetobacteraceae bacterium ESL0697]MDF7678406.1 hypothetical protein [Acetobacteraceae bacterium ESL0709]